MSACVCLGERDPSGLRRLRASAWGGLWGGRESDSGAGLGPLVEEPVLGTGGHCLLQHRDSGPDQDKLWGGSCRTSRVLSGK